MAEYYAAGLLMVKGYRILDLRWRCPGGELDIVALTNDVLVMVEVKARQSHIEGQEAVTYTNRRRIENASDFWLARHSNFNKHGIRFDIITVSGARIAHLKNAWYEGE